MPYPDQAMVEMAGPFWGTFPTTSDLPNVSGSTQTSDRLRAGHDAIVGGERYVCVTAASGSATWAKVASAGESIAGLTTTTLTATGAITATGGIVGTLMGAAFNLRPAAATTGTDTAFADGTQFVAALRVDHNITVTNLNYLIGSVGGTDKVYGVLYDSTGAVVIASSVSGGGATVGTAANVQTLAVTTPTAIVRGLYYIGISANGATAKIRTVPAHCQGGLWGNSVAQTHGTVAAITPPTTFTADKAPYVFIS